MIRQSSKCRFCKSFIAGLILSLIALSAVTVPIYAQPGEDSISISQISPAPGTTFTVGQQVTFTGTVKYTLVSRSTADITVTFFEREPCSTCPTGYAQCGDEKDRRSITQGSGSINFTFNALIREDACVAPEYPEKAIDVVIQAEIEWEKEPGVYPVLAKDKVLYPIEPTRIEVDVDTKYWEDRSYDLRITAQATPHEVASIQISGPHIDTATVEKGGGDPHYLYDDGRHHDGEPNDGLWWVLLNIQEPPIVGQTITFYIAYSDGSSEIKQKSIDGVLSETARLLSPPDGSPVNTLTPKFEWINPSISGLTYSVQVNDASQRVYEIYNLADGTTSHEIPDNYLEWGTTYYWLVSASDANGNEALTNWDTFVTQEPSAAGSVSGEVTDPAGIGIYLGTVSTNSTWQLTGEFGDYSLSLSPGTHSLTASAAEYNPQTKDNVPVTPGGTTAVDFSLTPEENLSYIKAFAPILRFDNDEDYFPTHTYGDDHDVANNHEHYDEGTLPRRYKDGKYICYYHVEDIERNGVTYDVIEYWYYYAFDPPWDPHEHDFEVIHLWINRQRGVPEFAVASEHLWDNAYVWISNHEWFVTEGGHGMDYEQPRGFRPGLQATPENFWYIPLDSLRTYQGEDLITSGYFRDHFRSGPQDHPSICLERGDAPYLQSRYNDPVLPSRIVLYASSPVEVRVYDSETRVTGLVNGKAKEDIPNSNYYIDTVVISPFLGTYKYEVVGTDEGTYKLEINAHSKIEPPFGPEDETRTFNAIDIPTTPGAVHHYTIDWDALSRGEEGVTVQMDSNGDGTFELTFTAGATLVSMTSFVIDHAKIDFKKKPDDDKVRVGGNLELNLANGNSVDISEDVTVTVGPLSETIKMAKKGKKDEKWEYKRPKDGEGNIKHMTINWKKGEFDIRMDKADLTGITNPVTITVQIGDDFGQETITMTVKKNKWEYKRPKGSKASIVEESIVQPKFGLSQNYPNPCNPETTIEFGIAEDCHVTLKIYNIAGQLIKTLVDEYQTAGHHTITWYGDTDAGQEVASGVYFYRIKAGDKAAIKKMVVLK